MVAYENEALVPGFDEEEGDRLSIILEGSGYDDRILILHLGGRIDTYNADYFERAIGKINATGYNRLLFMCGELNHVSASGTSSVRSSGKLLFKVRNPCSRGIDH